MSVNVVDKSTGQTTRVAGNATDSGIGNLSSLTTVDKTSLVSAINEVNGSNVKIFEGTVDDWEQLSTAEKKSYDYAALTNDYDSAAIGNLNSLTTTDKSSIVGAINEINEYTFVGTTTQWNNLTTAQKKAYKYRLLTDDYTDASIGSLSALHTTDKSSVVGAVNEVKDEVTNLESLVVYGQLQNNVVFLTAFKIGKVGYIHVGDLVSLPNGATTISNIIPEGYRPPQTIDGLCTFTIIRRMYNNINPCIAFTVKNNGNIDIYNYGSAIESQTACGQLISYPLA